MSLKGGWVLFPLGRTRLAVSLSPVFILSSLAAASYLSHRHESGINLSQRANKHIFQTAKLFLQTSHISTVLQKGLEATISRKAPCRQCTDHTPAM